ncbi:fatty acid hydroxylase [Sporocytophaga myxococcoides]|uniref:Fatty acid hydroxylase n=1 Tax=Sporocytophaga myxococcoides TaxID=153721 RepID=A0A098LBJ2_9BACT|nr:sterol desaturase family protein [Sporocytophaga myxococcoides]GAL83759.1 fatty acid hydroxylase [Sporocytophaga myxococcoides]
MEDKGFTTNKPKNSGTKQLFDNPILERLSRTHISIPISIFVVISAVLLYYAFRYTTLPGYLIPLLFLGGFLFFTLIEYLVHRFVFHMEPTSNFKKKIQYNMHGVHHEFPKDKDRLAMPPLLSITLAVIFFVIFYSLMNTKVFGFLPGLLMGYASYLFVHYIVHAYAPPKNIFKELWVNHAIHHYKDNSTVFGVSSPLWDYVFGTMPPKKKQA